MVDMFLCMTVDTVKFKSIYLNTEVPAYKKHLLNEKGLHLAKDTAYFIWYNVKHIKLLSKVIYLYIFSRQIFQTASYIEFKAKRKRNENKIKEKLMEIHTMFTYHCFSFFIILKLRKLDHFLILRPIKRHNNSLNLLIISSMNLFYFY